MNERQYEIICMLNKCAEKYNDENIKKIKFVYTLLISRNDSFCLSTIYFILPKLL